MTVTLEQPTAADTRPRDMWRMRPARDVRAGWAVQLLDGRTVTALSNPVPQRLGRVAIPYETDAHALYGLDPDYAHFGAGRLIPTRTPAEDAAYQQAVNDMAAIAARRGTK